MIIKRFSLSVMVASAMLMQSACSIHQSIGHSFGSYMWSPGGDKFTPVSTQWNHKETALVYIYRPKTEWSMDELEAPSVYFDDEHAINIKGNGYMWFEAEPSDYEIIVRRPMMGFEGIGSFDIKRVAELSAKLEAGSVYYLRYSEIDTLPLPDDSSSETGGNVVAGDGPLQFVTPDVALAEIEATRLLDDDRAYIKPKPPEPPESEDNGSWWWPF